MTKMTGVYIIHCEVDRCKKVYKTEKGFRDHMKARHPQAGPPLLGREYSTQLKDDMDSFADQAELHDLHPKDEANLFADCDMVTLDLNQPIDLPDPLIEVSTDHLDQDDHTLAQDLDQDLTALQRVHSTGDLNSFMKGAQALLTVANSVPACSEVSSFFLQNPTLQSSMDLTASQKIPLSPLPEETNDDSDSEEEKIDENNFKEENKLGEERTEEEKIEENNSKEENKLGEERTEMQMELNPFYTEELEDIVRRKSVIVSLVKETKVTKENIRIEVESKVSCGECGKVFATTEVCYYHMEKDHTETPSIKDAVFNCDICGELFESESKGSQHIKEEHVIHPPAGTRPKTNTVNDRTTKEEPYSCEVCGKVFKYSADNIVHQVEKHGHFGITDELKLSKQPVQPYLVHLLSEQTMLLYEEIDELKEEAREQKKVMDEEIVTLRSQVQNLLNIYEDCRKRWKVKKKDDSKSTDSKKEKTVKEKKVEPKSNIQIICDFCEVLTETTNEMETHIKNVHTPPPQPLEPTEPTRSVNKETANIGNTLLIGDSHIRSMNLKAIEKVTGGKLYTPGYLGGRRGRAYCSTKDWPEAIFPCSNLTDRVPELLAGKERDLMKAGHGRVSGGAPQERIYTNLIMQAPCNDISNLSDIGDQETQYAMAEQSSKNTILVMEKALKDFPSLKKGVILLRPPRADGLFDLSEHANFVLRGMAERSTLASMITIASMEELHFTDEEKMVKVFGPNISSKSYGIHMDGEKGKELFTQAIVTGIRSAGLNRRTQGVRKEQKEKEEKEQEVSPGDVWVTKGGKKTFPKQNRPSVISINNKYTGLN